MTYYGTHTVYCKRVEAGEYSCDNGFWISHEGQLWILRRDSDRYIIHCFKTLHDAIRYLMYR